MEQRMKYRLALLGSLLVIGLTLASIGTVLGAGPIFQGNPSIFGAVMNERQVTIYEDGRPIQNFTMPDDEEYIWRTSGGEIRIGKLTEEEIERNQAEDIKLNKLIEIARNDSAVQKIIAGKNYHATGMGQIGTPEMTISILGLEVEEKYYKVTIDQKNETVISVEEQNSNKISVNYGESY